MREFPESEAELGWHVQQFLAREAARLDDREYDAWLDMLSADLTYRIPRRVTRERGAIESEFSDDAFHMRESRDSMERRMERFDEEYAWSEDPPSRTRRLVGNVRLGERADDRVPVRSNFHLYYGQGDTADWDLLTGERRDVLLATEDGLKLAERTVLLDATILPVPRLSIPL